MSKLDEHPQVAQLANELGLNGEGNPLTKIRRYALARVREFVRSSAVAVTSLEALLQVLADQLSVNIEYVHSDTDLEKIADKYRFSEAQRRKLYRDLDHSGTDGLLTYNPDRRPGNRHYLAVVDARGGHAARVYFTAWHELTHLIVTPPQRAFEGVYRTISVARDKDPEESVVDVVAGELAFYEPLVGPVLEEKESGAGGVTISVIEEVRKAVAPDASFFATGIACLRLTDRPALLLEVAEGYKEAERRKISSPQEELDLGAPAPEPTPEVRAVKVVPSAQASDAGLAIFKNMRVPMNSVLYRAHESSNDVQLMAVEDQRWWETSRAGPQPSLPLKVEAIRRGSYVYGLITPA